MMGQGRQHQVAAAGLMLAVGAGILLGTAAVWSANAEDSSKSSRSSRAGTSKRGEGDLDASRIESKLDEILSGQEAILNKFDVVMEELRIIKVRATLRGGS
jgi:hypothetical protein